MTPLAAMIHHIVDPTFLDTKMRSIVLDAQILMDLAQLQLFLKHDLWEGRR